MSLVGEAQARVTAAEKEYSEAQRSGDPARIKKAYDDLAAAKENVNRVTEEQIRLSETNVEAMEREANSARALIDSEYAHEDALDRVKEAHAEVIRLRNEGKVGTDAYEKAVRTEVEANLDAADSAGKYAVEQAKAGGATDTTKLGIIAQRDELVKLATTAEGEVREKLLGHIAVLNESIKSHGGVTTATDKAKQALIDLALTQSGEAQAATLAQIEVLKLVTTAESGATVKSNDYKTALEGLAGHLNKEQRQAIKDHLTRMDQIKGLNVSTEEKTKLYKEELQRMADKIGGPVGDALRDMATRVSTLPDGSYTITADGKMTEPTWGSGTGYGARPTRRSRLPWCSPWLFPGVDNHKFYSPTGGELHLSGGDANVRPEWTQAVGPGFVHAANKAARLGGIEGVRALLGGGDDEDADSFAFGGVWRRWLRRRKPANWARQGFPRRRKPANWARQGRPDYVKRADGGLIGFDEGVFTTRS